MNYFYLSVSKIIHPLNVVYPLSLFKNSLPVFSWVQGKWSLKTGILFWGIYFKLNLKLKLRITLNVGKKEISFPVSIFWKSKNNFRKLILTFQHYQTLSQRIFFEWIPGLEVSGEKKTGCVRCPHWKPVITFMFQVKINMHKSWIWFFGALISGWWYAWTTHRLGVIAYRSAFSRFNGVDSPQYEK